MSRRSVIIIILSVSCVLLCALLIACGIKIGYIKIKMKVSDVFCLYAYLSYIGQLIYILIIPSVRLCATEVRALYGCLSCLPVVCAWRPWLRWEVGGVVARHAAGRNGRWRPVGAFSTAGARRLRAFLHYSSGHNRAWLVVIIC